MQDEANLFKILSDPTRLRLAVLLSIHGETCVCDLAKALGVQDFKISRHLGIMRTAGLVIARREGTWMHYQLNTARTELERCLLECFRDCLSDHPTVRDDLSRFGHTECGQGKRCGSQRKVEDNAE